MGRLRNAGRSRRLWVAALLAAVVVGADRRPAGASPPDVAADSLDALEDIARTLPDGIDAGEIARSWTVDERRGRALDARAVDGWRRSLWLRASPVPRLTLGGRWTPEATRGFAEWRSEGPVERVVVGGVRPSLAEGLVVGTRGASFAVSSMTRRAPGLEVAPSRSVVDARTGAGARLRLPGSVRLGLVGWGEEAGGRGWWTAVEASRPRGTLGVAAGRHRTADRGGGAPAEVSCASVYGAGSVGEGFVSAELARAAGVWLGAVRAGDESGWVIEGFQGAATGGFGGGVLSRADLEGRSGGGSIARRDRWGGVTWTTSVHTRRSSGGGRVRTRRRLEWDARRQGPGVRWSWRVRLDDERERRIPREVVVTEPTPARGRRLSARARVASSRDRRAGQSLQVEVLRPLEPAAGSGFVASVRLWGAWRFLDVEAAASDYGLAPGSLGYIVRPGVAGLETVTAVSGAGSDLSIRARCHLGPGGTIEVFADRPWGRRARVLMSAHVAWGH